MREAIEAAGIDVQSSELTMIPKTTVEVAEEASAKKLIRLIEALEDNDDVREDLHQLEHTGAGSGGRRVLARGFVSGAFGSEATLWVFARAGCRFCGFRSCASNTGTSGAPPNLSS